MSANEMRGRFEAGELTWADLLEITGLPAATLYEILEGLI
jgi:sugar-specific transcriptional regulator TrmB